MANQRNGYRRNPFQYVLAPICSFGLTVDDMKFMKAKKFIHNALPRRKFFGILSISYIFCLIHVINMRMLS